MTDGVVVLEPGDKRAKMIGRAMANQTAGEIMAVLKGDQKTLSVIAESLSLPMTTVKYHVENLLQAGMIEVVTTRYSEKGREVKVYGLCDQVVIMSPGKVDVKSLLLKYASLFGIIALATVLLVGLAPMFMPQEVPPLVGLLSAPEGSNNMVKTVAMDAESAVQDSWNPMHMVAIGFFSGGCLVLLLMIIYEIILFYRDEPYVK